jgi:hypothetical protein
MHTATLFSGKTLPYTHAKPSIAQTKKLGAPNARLALASLVLASLALLLQTSSLRAAQEHEYRQPPATPNQTIINAQLRKRQEREAYQLCMIRAAASIQADVRKIRQRAFERDLEKTTQSLLAQGKKEEELEPILASCRAYFKRCENVRQQNELRWFKQNLKKEVDNNMLRADIR